MAKLGIVFWLNSYFKGVVVKFKIKAIIEGPLKNNWVNAKSAIDLKKELEEIIKKLEYKDIAFVLQKENIKYKGMESLAIYILKKHKDLCCVEVWEGENEFAIVERKDLEG